MRRSTILIIGLMCIITFLGVLGFIGRYSEYYIDGDPFAVLRLISFDTESIGALWLAAILQAAAAVLLLRIGVLTYQSERWWGLPWFMLGAIFALLALDELLPLHRFIFPVLRERLGLLSRDGYSTWLVIAGGGLILLLAVAMPFLRHLSNGTRWRLIVAGLVYLFGAFALEAASEFYGIRNGFGTVPHLLLGTLEEWAELAGIALLIWAGTIWLTTRA